MRRYSELKISRGQRGMTMWGMAVVMALIVFFTLLGLQLVPPYLENFKVKSILRSIAAQPESGSMTRQDLVNTLQKRFDIDEVHAVDLKNDLTFENKGRTSKLIRIAYEVRVPLAYNISALLEFDNSVEVRSIE